MRLTLGIIVSALAFYLIATGLGPASEIKLRLVAIQNPQRCGTDCIIINGKASQVEGAPSTGLPANFIALYRADGTHHVLKYQKPL